jgi:dGTP triphosphohydrolase
MSIYIIKIDNTILGVFNDLQLAIDYSYSISKAQLLVKDTIKIFNYKQNSNILLEEIDLKLTEEVTKILTMGYDKNVETKQETIEEIKKKNEEKRKYVEEQNEIGQEIIEIKHKMNILKLKKEKMKETENIYETDLKLYNTIKKDNINVPELFKNKYELFKKLEMKNILNFDSFMQYYLPDNISTEYDSLFDNETSDNKIKNIFS